MKTNESPINQPLRRTNLDQKVQVHILRLGRSALLVAGVAAAGDEIDTHGGSGGVWWCKGGLVG